MMDLATRLKPLSTVLLPRVGVILFVAVTGSLIGQIEARPSSTLRADAYADPKAEVSMAVPWQSDETSLDLTNRTASPLAMWCRTPDIYGD